MALHLVTGYKGTPHITAPQQGAFNAGIVGAGEYVLSNGNKLAAVVTSSNSIKILDGDLVMQGRHITIDKDTFEEVAINNGEVDKNRNDLIVARYTKDATSGIENVVLAVIQGTSTADTATDPEYTTGDLLSGDCLLHEMPLYRIPLTGLTVGIPEAMFEVVNTLKDVNGLIYRGDVPFASKDEDTVENWAVLGAGVWKIPDRTVLSNYSYVANGTMIINIVALEGGRYKITQLALNGSIYTRAGNYSLIDGCYNFSKWTNYLQGSHPRPPIQTGCYWGTGYSGHDNQCQICTPFEPKFLLVRHGSDILFAIDDEEEAPMMSFAFGSSVSNSKQSKNGFYWDKMTLESEAPQVNFTDDYPYGVRWYTYDSATEQMNASGECYYYIVIGDSH